jgi:large subunit ribosomal protein L15
MPLVRRVPKRGFNNRFAATVAHVNVGDLERAFEAGDQVTPQALREKSLAKSRYDVLKILGDGELTKRLSVSAHRFSQAARQKIEQAGGQVTELPGPAPVCRKRKGASPQEQAPPTAQG